MKGVECVREVKEGGQEGWRGMVREKEEEEGGGGKLGR